MAGALKTLFGALQASTLLSGVSLDFGEERLYAEDLPLPRVVMVPKGGRISSDGYEGNGDPVVERRWKILERIDFYLWAYSTTQGALSIDHADAVETLRQQLLSALQDQRAQYSDVATVAHGNAFEVIEEQWSQDEGGAERFGRALIVSANFEITVDTNIGQEATVNSYQLNQAITQGPS